MRFLADALLGASTAAQVRATTPRFALLAGLCALVLPSLAWANAHCDGVTSGAIRDRPDVHAFVECAHAYATRQRGGGAGLWRGRALAQRLDLRVRPPAACRRFRDDTLRLGSSVPSHSSRANARFALVAKTGLVAKTANARSVIATDAIPKNTSGNSGYTAATAASEAPAGDLCEPVGARCSPGCVKISIRGLRLDRRRGRAS